MAVMADRSSSTSLNPSAPEFFPNYYTNMNMIIHTQTQFLGCVNPLLLPSPPPPPHHHHHHFDLSFNTNSTLLSSANPNPSTSCMYYSPFIHYNNSITCSYPTNPPNPLVSPQNHDHGRCLLVSTATEPSPPSDSFAETQNQVTQSAIEATEGIEPVKHENCGGYSLRERRRFSSCSSSRRGRRHARATSYGVSKQNRPAVQIQPNGKNTTVMIKNIPNRYTRELLMEFLDNHCMEENEKPNNTVVSAFDFLYLPMDFKNNANKGYAFVNFTHPKAAWKFHLAVNRQRWSLFQSGKICEIAAARLQGKEELVRHFQSSCFFCETDDYLPVCFSPPRDGSKATVKQTMIGRRIR